jgi:glycosyltransferase involved in cell wall biosynthesis
MPYQRRVSVSGGGDTSAWMSPMKMFEYMACRRPIVSSDLPVLREVLAHERNALLAEPGSVDAWVAAVERLRGDPELSRALAARAREDVTAYSWRARARRVTDGVL